MNEVFSNGVWRAGNAEWLTLRLQGLRMRLERYARWLLRETDGPPSANWLIAGEAAAAQDQFHCADSASVAITRAIAALEAQLAERERAFTALGAPPALRAVATLAGLGPLEEEVLLLAAAPALDGAFARAYAQLNDDPQRAYLTLHVATGLLERDGPQRLLVPDLLSVRAPLRALELVQVAADEREPVLTRAVSVDERMCDYLRGLDRIDQRVASVVSPIEPGAYGEMAETAAIVRMITQERVGWPTVNLVGDTDDGARETVSRACAAVELRACDLEVTTLSTRSAAEQSHLIRLLAREALLASLAFVVDATNLDAGATRVVDQLIEQLSAPLFLLSRHRWTGRGHAHRDLQVIEIARPTPAEQRGMWERALAERRHRVNGQIAGIVQQFDMGPAAILAATAQAARGASDEIDAGDLWRACRERSRIRLDELGQRIRSAYRWDDIVVRDEVRSQLRELAHQVALRARVYEEWGFGTRLSRGRGITACFVGPSGCGKSMAAEIVAAELDLDLYRIDLAGIVSKYIGETEKNLRQVFDAAQRCGAILFFDEADALFGARTEVRDSHDRYANIEVNYLLQRMEEYSGLAILATNRRGALDSAFLRRLRFVIEFSVPSAEERRRIWEQAFPAQTELADVDYGFLSRLELTGGNIHSIALNGAFLAAAEGAPVGMRHLMRAAGREYQKLSRPISASEFGPYQAAVRA